MRFFGRQSCILAALGLLLQAGVAQAGVAQADAAKADRALCGGKSFPLSSSLGPTPHIEIRVDGAPRWFLLDYGATKGTLWTHTPSEASTRKADIDLPGVTSAEFIVAYDSDTSGPGSPAGIIGTDVLSRMTVQLDANHAVLSATECDAAALASAGFRPIDQTGFFSVERKETDPSRPNVPVLFLRLDKKQAPAQIDTGYADASDSHSIDINQAMFEAIGAAALTADGWSVVATCAGIETRPVYRLKAQPLAVTDEKGVVLATVDKYRLVLKKADKCGGIAAMTTPAAQIGSLLRTLGTIVFDPFAHRVWIRAPR